MSEETALNNLRNIIQQLTSHQPVTPQETLAEGECPITLVRDSENARLRQELNKTGKASGDVVMSSKTGTGQAQQGLGSSNHGSAQTANFTAQHQPNKAATSSHHQYAHPQQRSQGV
ncbi:hypothetical protein EDD17DRAFT_1749833 [Pisolithus thermaeus]|nr:hypothetical protein EV401DRAFT_2067705 [Pisolithus croceorrhizus]KAI6168304.1 hypothetical protein EDD17DRAFT_1749833 [Pisolithus thermaeus]